jgi:hypothetical protein
MTAVRRDGRGSPFGRWLRSERALDSIQATLNVSDIDWILNKYQTCIDAQGSRDVQCAMWVELKTYKAKVGLPQQDLLFKHHQRLCKKGLVRSLMGPESIMLWHYGVCFLRLENDIPRNGDTMRWGWFLDNGQIEWRRTKDVKKVIELLGFVRRPDMPEQKLKFSRHHKTRKVTIVERVPIGFDVERLLDLSS